METKTECFRCKQNYENQITLSCKHYMCQKCLLRTLLKHHLLELPDRDSITIKCKCKNGNIELNIFKIGEILKSNSELSKIECKNHKQNCIKFCKECNKYLCEKCFNSHNDLFSDHEISNVTDSNNKPISINLKCSKHNKIYCSYCKNCKISLCNICLNEEETMKLHNAHDVIPYKVFSDKINEISNKLQFKNFESFNSYLEKMEKDFDKQFNDNVDKTTKIIESSINVLNKILDDYKKKMNSKLLKKNNIMSILKKVYQNYYEDIKSAKSGNKNISILKYLSKEYSEFSELSFRSELDSIISKLDSLKKHLEKEEISNLIKVTYAYFSKKELKHDYIIKDKFKDQINDIIELKDEKIVIASEDNSIKIFDKEGNCTLILNGHLNGVRALCNLKEGKIASGSADKTVRIWDLKLNKTIHILKEQSNQVISLNLLYDNKLASCSFREIFIYDEHFKQQYILKEHTNWIRNIIPIDKCRSISCSDDGTIKIYDKHFRLLNSFKDHNDQVLSICFLRDGRLISGDKNGNIIIWGKNLNYSKNLKIHNNAVLSIIQLKDGRIITGSADCKIKVWDLDFKMLYEFKNHITSVNCLCALKDGGFCSGGADCCVNVFH